MRSEYSNLRRRTRDSSWQWLLMGTILGMGFALVMCVGGYALGVITFPVLDDNTSTPIVRIEPNETEEALQELAVQQTLDAAQQTFTGTPTESGEALAALPTTDQTSAPQETEAPTASPSPLPNGDESSGDGADRPSETAMASDGESAPLNASTTPAPNQADVVALPTGGTPVVGTPPVGAASPTLSLPGPLAVPAELDAIKTDMVPVTGGTFLMGTTYEEGLQALDECAIYGTTCDDPSWVQDSTPPHQVTVDSFMMETYEVTVSQYVAFLNWLGPNSHKYGCQQGQVCAFTTQPGEKPEQSYLNFDGEQYSVRNADFYATHPVTLVTWWGAKEYCETLNRRLPTEAEWERAARGAENYLYPWGFEFENNRAQSSFPEATGTVEVTEFPNGASPYGVFNMAGNVSEWVSDWYLETYYNQQPVQPNPQGPPNGTLKVHRGGSWDTKPLFLRAVHRLANPPGDPTASIGFRCVSDQTTTPPPVVPVPSTDTGNPDSADGANTQPTMPPQPTFTPPPTPMPTEQPAGTLDPGG
jgi:formylglycine-generating enzyme required for sulfatase activity